MKEKVKRLIAAKAGALARKYGIKDRERVRRILERTAFDARAEFGGLEWAFIDPRDMVGVNVSLDPSLREALEFLPAEKALTTFESADLVALSLACHFIRWTTGGAIPFFTLSEFATIAEQLVGHLERDSEYLIRTGLPQRRFEKSEWFDRLLNHLCCVKLPVCVQANRSPDAQRVAEENGSAERDAEGNLLYTYSWVDKCPLSERVQWRRGAPFLERPRGSRASSTPLRFCGYEDAPFIAGLSSKTARKVERERERFLQVKMDVVNTWIRCLRDVRKRKEISREFINALSRRLTRDDARLWGRVDLSLEELKVGRYFQSLYQRPQAAALTRGLFNLFFVTVYLEGETTIGAWDRTKAAVLDILGDRGTVQSYFQVMDEIPPSDFWKPAYTLPESAQCEQALWEDISRRLVDGLEKELPAKILIEASVKSEYARWLKEFGQSQLIGWAAHLTEFGTIAPGGVGPEIGDAVSALSPGQEKDYKRFDYKCRDQVHVLGTRPMKRSNIINVNGHRVRIGDSLLKLFLRLVLELKKRKGGWVNIHTLEEEGLISDPLTYQRYSNLRKALEGSLLGKNGQDFIESDGSKSYRVSTHPDFITYDKKKLAKQHPDPDINEIAKKLP